MLALFHVSVSLACIFQCKDLINNWPKLALLYERPYRLAERLCDLCFVGVTSWAQGGAGDTQTSEQNLRHWQLGFGAAQQANNDQASIIGEAADVAGEVIAANHIQDEVYAAFIGELFDTVQVIILAVNNGFGCTEFFAGCGFVLIAHGGVNRVAEGTGDLYGRGAYAAAATVHQQAFTFAELTALEHIAPNGEAGFRQGSGLDPA